MDTHISRIRNKLELRIENGFKLATVYSYGYRLERFEAGDGDSADGEPS
jgi:DNA-binding response OmpR family regulator